MFRPEQTKLRGSRDINAFSLGAYQNEYENAVELVFYKINNYFAWSIPSEVGQGCRMDQLALSIIMRAVALIDHLYVNS